MAAEQCDVTVPFMKLGVLCERVMPITAQSKGRSSSPQPASDLIHASNPTCNLRTELQLPCHNRGCGSPKSELCRLWRRSTGLSGRPSFCLLALCVLRFVWDGTFLRITASNGRRLGGTWGRPTARQLCPLLRRRRPPPKGRSAVSGDETTLRKRPPVMIALNGQGSSEWPVDDMQLWVW